MELKAGYKQTEIGPIPEEWDVKSFGDLFDFRNGVNADKHSYGQGVPFINVLEPITYPHIHGPEIPGRVTLSESLLNSYEVRRGDVLFNRTSETQEEVGLASTYLGSERVVFGGFVISGRPKNGSLDPLYSGYALRAPVVRAQIIPMGQGAIRANISQQNLKLVFAPVPPPAEQQNIAAALSDVDALVEGLERLIAKKSDLKQAAMRRLITGKTRLPGFRGEWKLMTTGEIGRFRGGSGFPLAYQGKNNGKYPFFKVSDMNNEHNDTFMTTANNRISDAMQKQLGAIVFPPGTIVFAKVGAAIFLERKRILSEPSCLDNNMAGYTVESNRADIRFVHTFFLTVHLGSLVSTTALPSLNAKQLRAIELRLPLLDEQRAIAAVLKDMDAELDALEQRLAKTRNLKQAIMQELLTGKTRLVAREVVHA